MQPIGGLPDPGDRRQALWRLPTLAAPMATASSLAWQPSITLTGTTYIVATVPTGAVDGKVTVTTGSTTLTSTQTFIVRDSWSKSADMPTHVRYPAGVGAINGKIYVVGGITTGSTIIATSQVYNTATDKWTTAALLPTAATDGTGAVVNGILYVIGGYNGTNTLNTDYARDPL